MTTKMTPEQEIELSSEVMDSDEINVLCEARLMLRLLKKRADSLSFDPRFSDERTRFTNTPRPFTLGKLHEAMHAAESAIFNVLNTANSMCHVPVSETQMFPGRGK